MGAVNQEFNLKVNSGSFDQAIPKLEKTANLSDRLTSGIDRIAAAAQTAGGKIAGYASKQVELNRGYYSVTAATKDLITQLEPLQDAFNNAFTETQADRAMDNLIRKMDQLGLVFTSNSAEMVNSESLASYSLQELAEKGDIAANGLAEIRYEDKVSKNANKSESALKRVGRAAKSAVSSMLGFGKASNPLDGFTSKITRMVATLFTARKLMQYIRNSIARAPDEIGGAFTKLSTGISDSFTRVIVSMMGGMQGGVEKLNKAMNSASGQKFFRGLETAARAAGSVVGKALELIGSGIEFIGEHADAVFAVAAIAAGIFAAKMLVAAGATAAANLPIILMIGLLASVVAGLMSAGATAEDIFRGIGAGVGVLYAFVYNIVADLYNVLASFAEFFANAFSGGIKGALDSIARLCVDLADVAISMIESIAGAIGKLFGKDWSSGIRSFRNRLQTLADETFGEKKITIARMEKLDYVDTAAAWAEKGAGFGRALSDFNLSQTLAQPIKAINSDTSAIKKAVSLSKEDLKSLVDIAERRFVNNVNLTTLQPLITVNGANTGSTEQDRLALANAIKEVLIDQISSGSTVSTVIP